MNIIVVKDLDKNDNKVSLLNLAKSYQANMDVSLNEIEENSNQNMIVNKVRVNEINDVILDNMNAIISDIDDNKKKIMNSASHEIEIESFLVNRIDMSKPNNTDSSQPVTSYYGSINMRKNKKRKRHYNINKNKKWNKTYKRQKLSNIVKADTESTLQNNRKHTYTKVPKIVFNNKQAMHRGSGLSKFFLPDKRPRDIIVPPTKFLLGGNISDPLNLNSLQDEALVSISAVTPKSSPVPTPPKVEVIIPPNIYDPLHLLDPVDSIEYEKQLVSPIKNRRLNRQRSRKKKIKKCDGHETENIDKTEIVTNDLLNFPPSPKDVVPSESEETGEQQDNVYVEDFAIIEEKITLANNTRKRKSSECLGNPNSISVSSTKKIRRFDSKDKIVSPVIPQPGAWKRPPKVQLGAPRNRNRTTSSSGIQKYTCISFVELY